MRIYKNIVKDNDMVYYYQPLPHFFLFDGMEWQEIAWKFRYNFGTWLNNNKHVI